MPQNFDPETEIFLDHMAALTLQYPEVICPDCIAIALGEDNLNRVASHYDGSRRNAVVHLNKRARKMFSGRRLSLGTCYPGLKNGNPTPFYA